MNKGGNYKLEWLAIGIEHFCCCCISQGSFGYVLKEKKIIIMMYNFVTFSRVKNNKNNNMKKNSI